MNIAKDRKVLIWSLIVFGLPLLVYGAVHHRSPDADSPGPRPGAMLMSVAVGEALHKHVGDPNGLEGQAVYSPAVDRLGSLACWRFPILYRTRTPLGGMVLHHGTFWVKDGHVLRVQWD
jgi:hypothetical protein